MKQPTYHPTRGEAGQLFRFKEQHYPTIHLPATCEPSRGMTSGEKHSMTGATRLANLVLRVAIDQTAPRRQFDKFRGPHPLQTSALALYQSGDLFLQARAVPHDRFAPPYTVVLAKQARLSGIGFKDATDGSISPYLGWRQEVSGENTLDFLGLPGQPVESPIPLVALNRSSEQHAVAAALSAFGIAEHHLADGMSRGVYSWEIERVSGDG